MSIRYMVWSVLFPCALPGFGQQGMEFRDVTAEAGLACTLDKIGGGIAVGDYDGDGWQDICVTGAEDASPQIFRNQGELVAQGHLVRKFRKVTSEVMPYDAKSSSFAMFADLDNDGDQDLVSVRRYPDDEHPDGDPDETGVIFYEWRSGRFRDVNSLPDLGRSHNRFGGLALADTDVDGDLDVVYVHNGGAGGGQQGGPGFFLRNEGLPRFADATASFGADLSTWRRYFTVVLADFNGDMLPDLHTAVDFYSDWHCWNVGGGVYLDVTQQVHATHAGSDMGLSVGDIENDGDLDIYSTNIASAILYVNDGAGYFTEEASQRGCGNWGFTLATAWGTAFADLDLDRDQDLVLVAYGDPGFLFENDGAGYFSQATAGTNLRLLGHGLVPFDYDLDGDLDLLVLRTEPTFISLYENLWPADSGRHWLRILLQGTASNRDGVGAKVEVVAGGVTQTRAILAGYSFKSGPPMEAHYGLGDAAGADQVRVTWPSGHVSVLTNVQGDQVLTIVE